MQEEVSARSIAERATHHPTRPTQPADTADGPFLPPSSALLPYKLRQNKQPRWSSISWTHQNVSTAVMTLQVGTAKLTTTAAAVAQTTTP